MFNIRYHIASLVSVFLALAIGLFLGAAVVDQGAVEEGGAALVKSLKAEFDSLRTENAELAWDLRRSDEFKGYLVDEWALGRLENQIVLLVTSSESPEGVDDVVTAVQSAGGRVVTMRIDLEGFGEQSLAELAPLPLVTDPTEEDRRAEVGRLVVAELTQPTLARPTVDALIALQAIAFEGIQPTDTISVLVGLGDTEPTDSAVLALLSGGKEAGLPSFATIAAGGNAEYLNDADLASISTLNGLRGVEGMHAVVTLCDPGVPTGRYGWNDDGDYLSPRVVRP